MSSWQDKLKEIEKGCSQPDWDSYGSEPISKEALWAAERILRKTDILGIPEPFIFPTVRGGLEMEWTNGDTYNKHILSIQIDVDGLDNSVGVWSEDEDRLINSILLAIQNGR